MLCWWQQSRWSRGHTERFRSPWEGEPKQDPLGRTAGSLPLALALRTAAEGSGVQRSSPSLLLRPAVVRAWTLPQQPRPSPRPSHMRWALRIKPNSSRGLHATPCPALVPAPAPQAVFLFSHTRPFLPQDLCTGHSLCLAPLPPNRLSHG